MGCRADYWRLGGLSNRSLFPRGFGGCKSAISVSPALLRFEDRWPGMSSQPVSQASRALLALLHLPCLVDALPQAVILLTWCFSVCVCVCVFVSVCLCPPFLFMRTPVIGFRPALVHYDLILTRSIFRDPIPSKVTITGLGGQDSQHPSWGHSAAYNREYGPQVDGPALARPVRGDRQEQKVRGCPAGVQKPLLLKLPSPKQGFRTLVGL